MARSKRTRSDWLRLYSWLLEDLRELSVKEIARRGEVSPRYIYKLISKMGYAGLRGYRKQRGVLSTAG